MRWNSDLKESLETMKKRYGTYGRNVSWIVKDRENTEERPAE
jgi:hypothetical protein